MRERDRGPPVGPQGRQGREEGGEQSLAPRIKVHSKVGDEQIPPSAAAKQGSLCFFFRVLASSRTNGRCLCVMMWRDQHPPDATARGALMLALVLWCHVGARRVAKHCTHGPSP